MIVNFRIGKHLHSLYEKVSDLGIVYFRIKHEYFFYIESYTFWIGDGALINSS